MATKSKTQFKCKKCSATYTKWQGQCNSCGEWNTVEEDTSSPSALGLTVNSGGKGIRASKAATGNQAKPVAEIAQTVDTTRRLKTGITEFDRVLGGGLVYGGVILLAGTPGVGKSSAALAAASAVANK